MRAWWVLGILCAVLLHAGFLLFGGIFFPRDDEDHGTLQEVELVSEVEQEQEKEEKAEKEQREDSEAMEVEEEAPPEAAELMTDLELASPSDAPALEAASLGAIEQALSGVLGGGDFADALSFSSGGRIGGTGKLSAIEQKIESAFSLAEMDQRPRVMFQVAPLYPAALRSKKLEGVVQLIFLVDATGKVVNPRVEKSSHPAFEKPALDAIKQWKFEPGVRAGARVDCRMRQPIRFQPSPEQ